MSNSSGFLPANRRLNTIFNNKKWRQWWLLVTTSKWFRQLVGALAWLALFLAVGFFYVLFFNPESIHIPSGLQVFYPWFGRRYLVGLLLIVLPFGWYGLLRRDDVGTYMSTWLLLVLTVILGFTMSLMGLVAGTAQLFFIIWCNRPYLKAPFSRTILGGLLIFLLSMVGLKQWLLQSGTQRWLCERTIVGSEWCLDQQPESSWWGGQLINQNQRKNDSVAELEAKTKMADEFYDLAKQSFLDKQWQVSAEWLAKAQRLDPWIISRSPVFVPVAKDAQSAMIDFIRPLATVPHRYYGGNRSAYVTFFNQVLLLKTQKLVKETDRDVNLTLAHERGDEGIDSETYRQRLLVIQQALLRAAGLALSALPIEAERDQEMVNELVAALIRTAEYGSSQAIFLTARLYQSALALRPSAMNNRPWWFEQRTLDARDQVEVYHFLDNWHDWESSSVSYNPQVFVPLVQQGMRFANQEKNQGRYLRYSKQLKLLEATNN